MNPGASPGAAAQPDEGLARIRDLLLASPGELDPGAGPAALAGRFSDPAAAWQHLQDLARERHSLLAPGGRARSLLAELAPRLLAGIAAHPEPDRTLRNLQRAIANLGAKATVYQLWAEQPDAQALLVGLAAGSDVLPAVLAAHPGLLDEVIDRLLTRTPPRAAEVQEEAGRALRCGVGVARALREIRALHLLLVGALDLAGRQNLQNTARSLAEVAEGLLRAVIEQARVEVAARHAGEPAQGRLCVLALGRLGARELCYGSDLDLLFVWDGPAPAGDGTAPQAFWSEVAHTVAEMGAGPASPEGALLPIDLTGRPGGTSGPLAVERRAALEHYRGRAAGASGASHVERLALQKARPVGGTPGFQEQCLSELTAVLYQPGGPQAARAVLDEVLALRSAQRAASSPDDIEQGPGSLADVELTASAVALLHGAREPGLRQPSTARLLDALEKAARLTPAEHRDLRTAWAYLRRVELRLRARDFARLAVMPGPGVARQVLARQLGYEDVGHTPAEVHFARELTFHRERIEAITTRLASRERALLGLAS